MSKKCFKCGVEKDLSEFYPHKRMADGHLNKCKECTKSDVHQNRVADPAKYSEYEKKRLHTPKRKEQRAESQRVRRKKYPEKEKARATVARFLKKGWLTKKPCEICGDPETEAHHDDYSKPLDVRWLCFKHHREEAHGQTVVS